MNIPKRVSDRITKTVQNYQSVLKNALDRDVNESDTVLIIKDILSDVFGYDKYVEVTSEYAIRGTYCDIAVKIDDKVEFLLEAKAIGLDLKESHLRQVLDYGANNGIQWVILTNGVKWFVYKIKFEKPIGYDLVCVFDLLAMNAKSEQEKEKLYLLCREGIVKDVREQYFEKRQSVNRFVVAQLLLEKDVLSALRRNLKKISNGVSLSFDDISKVLKTEVIKRDVFECDEAKKAKKKVRGLGRKKKK